MRTRWWAVTGVVVLALVIGMTVKMVNHERDAEQFAVSASRASEVAGQMGCPLMSGPSETEPAGSAWSVVCSDKFPGQATLRTFPSADTLQKWLDGPSGPGCAPYGGPPVIVGNDWVVQTIDDTWVARAVGAGGYDKCPRVAG